MPGAEVPSTQCHNDVWMSGVRQHTARPRNRDLALDDRETVSSADGVRLSIENLKAGVCHPPAGRCAFQLLLAVAPGHA